MPEGPGSAGSDQTTIAALAEENAQLRHQLEAVLGSSSWRLTRPLRRLRRSDRPEAPAPPVPVTPAAEPARPEAAEPAEAPVPMFFPPGHYYSPVVDPAELAEEPRRSQVWPPAPRATPGVDWREAEQIALFRDVFARQPRLDFREEASEAPSEYYALNGMFPPLDAWLLEAILRWARPRRMIEVGSGFSSLVSARVNRELLDGSIRLTCIEPYPRPFLTDGIAGLSDLIVAKIQDVPLEEFSSLNGGDILFIDTSHTVKTGGDVTWIFHEIVPRLAPGVVVHVHDAFLPGDYPEPWVLDGWGWNEAYLLQSFLAFNGEFEVVAGVQYMVRYHPEVVSEAFPEWLTTAGQGGASLWLRRKD